MSAVLLNVFAPGTPRPKGSMRHVGNGRLVEQVNNRDWRATVVDTAHQAIRCCGDCNDYRPGYPSADPVSVRITLYLPTPKRPKHPVPAGRNTGDVDKHARLVLDALQAAGVIADDSAVVDLQVSKRYGGGVTGAGIVVVPYLTQTTAAAGRHEVPPSPEEPAAAVPGGAS